VLEGSAAEFERLREQEAAVESWAELSDVEQATFERLSELRRVIAGEAEGEIDPVRAALARIFEQFVLHRADSAPPGQTIVTYATHSSCLRSHTVPWQ
jgi:hypothetical protein